MPDISQFEQELTEVFENGQVTQPGEIIGAIDPEDAEAAVAEIDASIEEALTDESDDTEFTDEDLEGEGAEEDSEADGEVDASADESGDGAGEGGDAEPAAAEAVELDGGILVPTTDITIGDRTFTPEEFVAFQQSYAFTNSLTQEHREAINNLFSGQYYLVPVSGEPVGGTQAPAPTSTTVEDPDDEYLDPRAAQDIAALREEMESLRAAQATQSQRETEAVINETSEAYFADWDQTDTERVQQAAFESGLLPVFYQRNGGDAGRATRALYDHISASDPILQAKIIDQKVAERFEAERAASESTKVKKRKAGSLGGQGGAVSRQVRQPSSPDEMREAMVQEIAAAQSSA